MQNPYLSKTEASARRVARKAFGHKRALPVEPKNPVSALLRLLVIVSYLSPGLSFGFFLPFACYLLFRRNPFVRYHSLVALLLHLAGWLTAGLLRLPSYFFVIELKQVFLTPEDFAGKLFSEEAALTWTLIAMLSAAFYLSLIFLAGMQTPRSRFHSKNAGLSVLGGRAFLSILLVPVLFYMQGLWGAAPTGVTHSFFELNLELFSDPARLIPGHFILLYCMCFAVYAWHSERPFLWPFTKIYVRLEKSQRKRGLARYKSARLRSRFFPGWGQLYEGRLATGLATSFAFLLGLLFFWISLGLWYGKFVEEIPYLNANFTWYFLGQLGLRSHGLSDRAFQAVFGNPWMLLFLGCYLVAIYAYSLWELRLFYRAQGTLVRHKHRHGQKRRPKTPALLSVASLGLLLHLTPIGIALLIPVTVNPFPALVQALSGLGQEKENEGLVEVIPELYDSRNASLDSPSYFSGEEGKGKGDKQAPRALAKKTQKALQTKNQERQSAKAAPKAKQNPGDRKPQERQADSKEPSRPLQESLSKGDGQKRLGKRQKQNYSSYLSIKIRSVEKGLHYWKRAPENYSSVVEYKITKDGRVHGVRLVEPSNSPASDERTLELIRRLDPVIAPPGGKELQITELFWNTKANDAGLPSPLKRRLSGLFDGREIKENTHLLK